mmetsp:Transcript_1392/g.3912  ORF Transcript_1392/g.3912 Transcript_1392/m.3912 type:complete len:582 (-) Transcript_1392:34-1779(-)
MEHFSTLSISNLASAFARLGVTNMPLFAALAAEARAKISEFSSQGLGNLAWAVATCCVEDRPLMDAISAAALPNICELGAQSLVNTAWAFARLVMADRPLLKAIAVPAIPHMHEFIPQELSNTAWSFAARPLQHGPLMDSIAAAARQKMSALSPQDISNTAWAFAKLGVTDLPLLHSLASTAIQRISQFDQQGLSNIFWSCAEIGFQHLPLRDAIASEALRRITDFECQGLSNIAWALATLSGTDGPLLDAISSSFSATGCQVDAQFVLGAAWPLWRLSRHGEEWGHFRRCISRRDMPDAFSFGFLFMLTEWQRDPSRCEWLRLIMASSDTLRLPEPAAGGPLRGYRLSGRVSPGFQAYIDRKYHKLVSVIDFIAASGAVGAEAIVRACEVIASGSQRQWLKVAGDEKAEVVDMQLGARPAPDRGIVAEFGSFVGYSCTRMAWRSGGQSRVLSLESDAVHVLVARHVVAEARLSWVVEVVSGMAHDSVRRLADEWGGGSTALAFMDHRGTRFHVELMHLERLRALAPGAKFLADNTLKPGAPVMLWHFANCPSRHPSVSWSLPEFMTEDCEDWMTASDPRP